MRAEGRVAAEDGPLVVQGALEGFFNGRAELFDAVPEILLECANEVVRGVGEAGLWCKVAEGLVWDGEVGRHHWGGRVAGAI